VPIGADQKQHLEIARDIAERFNGVYGDVFVVPEGYFPKVGARVMSLQEPTRKMSKSDPEETYIAILDKPEIIRKKIRRAVTDSDNTVVFDPENKPGVANLMNIYSAVTGLSFEQIEHDFEGRGYGAFKPAVGDAVIETLRPIREESSRMIAEKEYLRTVYTEGAQRASAVARRTLRKVYKRVGFVEKPF
jgi:tryptophanyl-tRNA synthetase